MNFLESLNTTNKCIREETFRISDELAAFSMIYFIFFVSIITLSLLLWFIKRAHPYLAKRSFFPEVILIALAGYSNLLASAYRRGTSPSYVDSGFKRHALVHDCVFFSFTYNLTVPLLLLSQFARVFHWLLYMKFNKLLSEYQEKVTRQIQRERVKRCTAISSTTVASPTQDKDYQKILSFKKYTSATFKTSLLTFLLLISITYALAPAIMNCPSLGVAQECTISDSTINSFVGVFFNAFPTALFIAFLLVQRKLANKYPDPFGILNEINMFFQVGLSITLTGIFFAIVDPFDIYDEDKSIHFDYGIIAGIGIMASVLISVTLPIYKVYSPKVLKIEYSVPLTELLSSPSGAKLFRSHLIYEFSVENLNFYETARAWKKEFSHISNPVPSAKNLYKRYISDEAVAKGQVNLGYDVKQRIQDSISKNEVYSDLFDEAINQVYALMSSDSYSRFMRTETFAQYMGTNPLNVTSDAFLSPSI
eukprot:snap_masked-scaffold_8-processed-gene-1.34-mRNA-1 protein AED:1.00 eAED:1.00 QI:0/-1/0/0/-1/1/1/0/478